MTLWLLFVTKIGPKLMAIRKPFNLRWLMFAYNILMAVTNAYFFGDQTVLRGEDRPPLDLSEHSPPRCLKRTLRYPPST
ncbi:unnamed protein product [Oppiella nova]|uniref:Very-long-chain 3-oxoacyl-CoA synthase n=1 Tax=Oppiella nova TaxID=334625 RepID=A0A7R9M3G0_9ACAR|nr:unnamed protein product [Oppiella nova]CAG2170068.1 unnamed protein product [Oppiella nova]